MKEYKKVDQIHELHNFREVQELRHKFQEEYCLKKRWPLIGLSDEQIEEIRNQPEWLDPLENYKK